MDQSKTEDNQRLGDRQGVIGARARVLAYINHPLPGLQVINTH